MNNQEQKSKPKWLIPVIVIAGIIVLGLIVWGAYELFKSAPVEEPVVEDEFKDWKTYRNEEHGFEMEHPNTFLIKEESGVINFYYRPFEETEEYNLLLECETFEDPADIKKGIIPEFSLIQTKKEDNLSVPDHLRKMIDFLDLKVVQVASTADGISIFNISDEQPDSYWVKFPISSGLEARWGTFQYDNWRFYITRWQDSLFCDFHREKYRNLPLKILSTFKFIEPDETANWKTYRNEIIGIVFKYPNEWPELGNEERGDEEGTSFALNNFPDLSHLNHTLPDYDNMPVDEQYEQIKCKHKDLDAECKEKIDLIGFENMSLDEQIQCGNIDIECEERISINGVKYVWRISWNFRTGSSYMALVATGKYILIFDFQEKENYEKRANQYQKLLSTLKIPE